MSQQTGIDPDISYQSNQQSFSCSHSESFEFIPKEDPIRPPFKDTIVETKSTPFYRAPMRPINLGNRSISTQTQQKNIGNESDVPSYKDDDEEGRRKVNALPTESVRSKMVPIGETDQFSISEIVRSTSIQIQQNMSPSKDDGIEYKMENILNSPFDGKTKLQPFDDIYDISVSQPKFTKQHLQNAQLFHSLKKEQEEGSGNLVLELSNVYPPAEQPVRMVPIADHKICDQKLHHQEDIIKQLRETIDTQKASYDLESKANELYMNMFQKMKFLCSTYCHRETEDIDEAISIIDDNMRAGWERELSGERKLSRDWGACLNIDKQPVEIQKPVMKTVEQQTIESQAFIKIAVEYRSTESQTSPKYISEQQTTLSQISLKSPTKQQKFSRKIHFQQPEPKSPRHSFYIEQIQNLNQPIPQEEVQTRDVKAELLRTAERNINAILYNEDMENNSLQAQMRKMKEELADFKENMLRMNELAYQSHGRRQFESAPKEVNKVIKIYTRPLSNSIVACESDEDVREALKLANENSRKNQNQNRKRKNSSESNISDRNKRLNTVDRKMSQLIDGYKNLQGGYKHIQKAISELSSSQSEFRNYFKNLRTDIVGSIESKIQQIKVEESNGLMRKLEKKLNLLINTLNAPEQVRLQPQDEQKSWLADTNVNVIKDICQVQNQNRQLVSEVQQIKREKNLLKGEFQMFKSLISTHTSSWKQSQKKLLSQSYGHHFSYDKGERIGMRDNATSIYNSGTHKQTELAGYTRAIYERIIKQKDAKIKQLQQTISFYVNRSEQPVISYIEASSIPGKAENIERYELTISNLKLLLADSKKEIEELKRGSFHLSRVQGNQLNRDLSCEVSNDSKQDKQIATAASRPNAFQEITTSLQIQESIENAVTFLLQVLDKITIVKTYNNKKFQSILEIFLKNLLIELRKSSPKFYEQLNKSQQIGRELRKYS